MKRLLVVLAFCFGSILGFNAFPAVNKDPEFSFFTIYNPNTHQFISDLPEMLRILYEKGFRQVRVETGEWTSLNAMMGCECVRIYTYRKGDIIVKLYIDEIMDPHGEWISTDIIYKSKAKQEIFLKEAIGMGFQEGMPFEGSAFYTSQFDQFESGGRYVAEIDEIWPSIQLGGGYDDPDRDAQIFRLTSEVRAKLHNYDDIDLFSYGLARVCKAGKWGFIDLKGNEVIPCVYDMNVGRFSEGFALVELDFDFNYDASRVKFIDTKGREIYGNYFIPRKGTSIDCIYEGLPVFYNGECPVLIRAKYAYPNGNYEDNELLGVTINKNGHILPMGDDANFFDENNLTGDYMINCYPYGDLTPIQKAYENEALTGSPYYIGRDTIPGGNGSSLVSLYLVDLTKPKPIQLVEEMHGIMDYYGYSTISQAQKVNFERRARLYVSRCSRSRDKNNSSRAN